MEFLIRDRLSWLRFLGFELGQPTPDENTIRSFRERLTRAEAIRRLFDLFDQQLRAKGYRWIHFPSATPRLAAKASIGVR
jgi:IS5 family transposase